MKILLLELVKSVIVDIMKMKQPIHVLILVQIIIIQMMKPKNVKTVEMKTVYNVKMLLVVINVIKAIL